MTMICGWRPSLFVTLAVATILLAFVPSCVAQSDTPTRPLVSEEDVPFDAPSITARDGERVTVLVRRPPGAGPFPALVYLHGALGPWNLQQLKNELMGPTLSRFLASGYLIAIPSLRRKRDDPQSQYALWDALAVIQKVKEMPEVDPKSIVVYGDSGGGSLALEAAGETELQAIAVQEPATVLFTGMYGKEHGLDNQKAQALMANPGPAYTPELQKLTREKIGRIKAPIFIAHSDVHIINKINNEIFIPELKRSGKTVEVLFYPGQQHGWSRGVATPEAALKFFEEADRFFHKYIKTAPKPLAENLVKQVPTGRRRIPDRSDQRSDDPHAPPARSN